MNLVENDQEFLCQIQREIWICKIGHHPQDTTLVPLERTGHWSWCNTTSIVDLTQLLWLINFNHANFRTYISSYCRPSTNNSTFVNHVTPVSRYFIAYCCSLVCTKQSTPSETAGCQWMNVWMTCWNNPTLEEMVHCLVITAKPFQGSVFLHTTGGMKASKVARAGNATIFPQTIRHGGRSFNDVLLTGYLHGFLPNKGPNTILQKIGTFCNMGLRSGALISISSWSAETRTQGRP